jgi:uncharacterized protein (DUF2141 family)
LTLLPVAPPAFGEPAAGAITVSVGRLRSSKGSVGCRLYSLEKGFPRNTEGSIKKNFPVSGPFTACVFEHVPPGTYALVAIHDENDNDKLDRNFVGMPTEGYGVSNNRTYATKAPVWSECKFSVEASKNRKLTIELRY